ncbi:MULTISPECIES: hypothetical protein [Exiguobacterium]|uniref:hypothetical protein n=1 Tax=Exiguobacterium TaxID=33986 RepID=UPI001BEC7318|nr:MULTISPECIES: hypothetical protein [Exiguobacterium]MCT4782693.1 hypothetical protein [Exiguobacterium himgiriensis]
MTKQERINAIYKSNMKMAVLQGFITFPMMFFTVGVIRSDSWNGWYVLGIAVCLLLFGASFFKANQIETNMTEHEGAQRIITRRNGFLFGVFVLSILAVALTLKLGWAYVWILIVTGGVLYVGYRWIRRQDERLSAIDPEHPNLFEVRLDHVKD